MADHYLTVLDLEAGELRQILTRAAQLKSLRRTKGLAALTPKPLADQSWGLLFEKASTRTRVSFEVGVNLLGGSAMFMSPDQLHLGRGEPLEDTARILSRYLDGLVVRTYGHDRLETLAKWGTIPVINALSDLCHPCQVLADLQTVGERLGKIEGFKAAWVGDGNNVAYSWIAAAIRLGFELTLACPPGYGPEEGIMARAAEAKARIRVVHDPVEAVSGAEVINTDVWISMGQEKETQARRKAFAGFQVNSGLLARAAPKAVVLHCLPAHRGEEITDEVIEGPQSAVFDQAENRLYVQMALMETLAGSRGRS